MQQTLKRILVVDDEENIRHLLTTVLKREGLEARAVASAQEALEAIDAEPFDVLLSDVRMPQVSGLELLEQVQARQPSLVVIMMSAYGTIDAALEAIKKGAYDYINKPFKPAEVVLLLRKVEERERLRRENASLRQRIEEIGDGALDAMVARSEAMKAVFKTVRKIATYKTTVLIQGESGTGKELIARALHRESPRAERPFVAVNCGAIPDTLLESELFGHVRGAFTDATSDKKGLFAEADGGTLFLDEVGELPLPLQVKLLRVLQEEEVRPVGASRGFPVDVRVIAATVRDLYEEVEAQRFREDLFYRLNVLLLALPPLRQRRDDIPLLVEHFIDAVNQRLGTTIRTLSAEALKRLVAYDWPGNVRELENTIERAAVLAESDAIELDALPTTVADPQRRSLPLEGLGGGLSIKQATRVIEEQLIRRALEQTNGNRTAAAKLLEISHRALLYKIKAYGLISN
ncbi:MAG: sigma-54-dependent Fis family transcriptional regulator [Deltaproteobacteria bacterium]|nr:sigma-54-dependent Fis family transcriptional regulator [Deltaproteobacteria bacterium]